MVKQAKLDCKALGLLTLWLFLHTKFICFFQVFGMVLFNMKDKQVVTFI